MNRVVAALPKLSKQCLSQAAASQCLRTLTTSQARFAAASGGPGPERVDISHIKAKQRHYQIDDGTPIYLKGGLMDKVLFFSTVLICIAGLGYSGIVIYRMAIPPKND